MRLIETGIPEQVENTKALLYNISNHLSGVRGCRKVEYEVTIKNHEGRTQVKLDPGGIKVVVWGRGKGAAKADVLYHILNYHLSTETPPQPIGLGEFEISSGHFVIGMYKYTLSPSGKTRHWQSI
jgi:hypothetical protein